MLAFAATFYDADRKKHFIYFRQMLTVKKIVVLVALIFHTHFFWGGVGG
jgi:hypothetical protein